MSSAANPYSMPSSDQSDIFIVVNPGNERQLALLPWKSTIQPVSANSYHLQVLTHDVPSSTRDQHEEERRLLQADQAERVIEKEEFIASFVSIIHTIVTLVLAQLMDPSLALVLFAAAQPIFLYFCLRRWGRLSSTYSVEEDHDDAEADAAEEAEGYYVI